VKLRKLCKICNKLHKKNEPIRIMEDEWVHVKCFDNKYVNMRLV